MQPARSWRHGLWRWARRSVAPFGELCLDLLLERPLTEPLPRPKAGLDVLLRPATEADLDDICRIYAADPWLFLGATVDDPAARELYADRLRRGERCLLAVKDGAIAHVNWMCWNWGDAVPGYPIRLRPREVYTTDAFTAEPYRGQGLHALVLRAMLAEAQDKGAQRAYTLARPDRRDSLKGLSLLGWVECGRVLYFLPRGAARPLVLWRRGRLEPLFRRPMV